MSVRMKIAFVFHLFATILLACFGVTYLLRTEFMPYHSVAVGMTWAQVLPSFRVLILGLMKAFGSCCIGIVIYVLVILFLPFRRGHVWAKWTIPAGGLAVSAGILYTTLYVASNSPASPPWIAPVTPWIAPVIVALLLLADLFFQLGTINNNRITSAFTVDRASQRQPTIEVGRRANQYFYNSLLLRARRVKRTLDRIENCRIGV